MILNTYQPLILLNLQLAFSSFLPQLDSILPPTLRTVTCSFSFSYSERSAACMRGCISPKQDHSLSFPWSYGSLHYHDKSSEDCCWPGACSSEKMLYASWWTTDHSCGTWQAWTSLQYTWTIHNTERLPAMWNDRSHRVWDLFLCQEVYVPCTYFRLK